MGSDELSLLFWFVSNIYKLNIINYKLLKKREKLPAFGFHFPTTTWGECETLLVQQVNSAAKGWSWARTQRHMMLTVQRRKHQLTHLTGPVSHLFRESRSVRGGPLFSLTPTDPSLETHCWNGQTLFHGASLVLKPRCSVTSHRAAPERRSSWECCVDRAAATVMPYPGSWWFPL